MRPSDETELAEAVRGANGPLRIVGGGTRGVVRGEGEVLEVAALSGISLYEPGALTLVAGAGTPLAEVEVVLAAARQRLAFEVPDLRGLLGRSGESTLGGVVAANASGPRRVQVGACRDALLGVRFVDGAGVVIRNGGRVMKNVTGYDLVRLMAGAQGTLGVLTEVAFKVLPVPEAAATLCLHGLSTEAAVAVMARALGSPYEVSGAAHVAAGPALAAVTSLRVEGFAESVAYRVGRLQALLAGQGDIVVQADAQAVDRHWRALRDVAALQGGAEDVWRLSVVPGHAPGIVARMPEGARVCLDWGGGLIWAATPPGLDVRALLGPFAGHATRVRRWAAADDGIAAHPPEAPGVAALTAGLRARFDPRGLFNPATFGSGAPV